MAYNLAQKILNDDKTVITNMSSVLSSIDTLSICNIHTADISVDLYAASQVGTDITDTGTNVNYGSGYAVTTSSQAIVVDGTAATSDVFLDEQIWKSDGTLFGTCTTFTDGTHITFGDGIAAAMVDDDSLYAGTRYYILKGVNVPANTTLVLEQNELRVDPNTYTMYIKSSHADGNLDVIIRK